MYAIKIVNEDYTTFYLADELTYKYIEFDKDNFQKQIDEINPIFQIGDLKKDIEGSQVLLYLSLYRDPKNVNIDIKDIFIMPESTIYIMQDSKTIEVIKVK